MTSLLNYPFELVAPMAAIVSILLLPLGPLLIPRFYLIFLLIYFTCFLYTQINHVFKFWITVSNIKKTIRNWNMNERNNTNSNTTTTTINTTTTTTTTNTTNNDITNSTMNEKDASAAYSAPASPTPTPTRERYPSVAEDDERMNDMESTLKLYDDNHFVHAFIVPNYAEPEALLRDTIKRLANHR
jgi:hypothetical protein